MEPTSRLTMREIEVLWLIARGCTYARVGVRLGISSHTVAAHVKNAYRKLDVHSAGAAVMRALELRLFTASAKDCL
jgi:DNA-binding CsgD family transcriptional regulator